MMTIMTWIADTAHYTIPAIVTIGMVVGYIFRGAKVKKIRTGLAEVKALILFAQKAMADGNLSESERDELIDRIGEIVKVVV